MYAPALEALGIADYASLITCDPDAIVAGMRERGFFLSVAEVERWCHHAESYRDARPTVFGPPPPVGDAFIALDMEYDTFNPHIWLIGLHLVEGDHHEHVALWADGRSQERRILTELAERVAMHPELPVLTWSGQIMPFVCFGYGCDFEKGSSILDRVVTIAMFGPLREINVVPLGESGQFAVAVITSARGNGLERDGKHHVRDRQSQHPLLLRQVRRGQLRGQLIILVRSKPGIGIPGLLVNRQYASPAPASGHSGQAIQHEAARDGDVQAGSLAYHRDLHTRVGGLHLLLGEAMPLVTEQDDSD